MRLNKKKFLFGILAVIFLSILGGAIGRYLLSLDETVGTIESYLKTNEYVIKKIGPINKLILRKRIHYYGSQNEAPYVQYTFVIQGLRGNLVVHVRIDPSDKQNIKKYKLVSANNRILN